MEPTSGSWGPVLGQGWGGGSAGHPLTRQTQCPLRRTLGRVGLGGMGERAASGRSHVLLPPILLPRHTRTKPVPELILPFQKSCKNGSTPYTLHPDSSNIILYLPPPPPRRQIQDIKADTCATRCSPHPDFSGLPARAPPPLHGPCCIATMSLQTHSLWWFEGCWSVPALGPVCPLSCLD